jgi:hypothetical protein
VHGNTCEGTGAALRTNLRTFRGVHKRNLHLYVATFEAMVNTKRVTPKLIRRMCIHNLYAHSSYTCAKSFIITPASLCPGLVSCCPVAGHKVRAEEARRQCAVTSDVQA